MLDRRTTPLTSVIALLRRRVRACARRDGGAARLRLDDRGLVDKRGPGRQLGMRQPCRVPDADTVYRRAKAARAEIVVEIKDEDYGGRVFSCRDPEGHLWNIPWKASS